MYSAPFPVTRGTLQPLTFCLITRPKSSEAIGHLRRRNTFTKAAQSLTVAVAEKKTHPGLWTPSKHFWHDDTVMWRAATDRPRHTADWTGLHKNLKMVTDREIFFSMISTKWGLMWLIDISYERCSKNLHVCVIISNCGQCFATFTALYRLRFVTCTCLRLSATAPMFPWHVWNFQQHWTHSDVRPWCTLSPCNSKVRG